LAVREIPHSTIKRSSTPTKDFNARLIARKDEDQVAMPGSTRQ
jgi:hypothetical protein